MRAASTSLTLASGDVHAAPGSALCSTEAFLVSSAPYLAKLLLPLASLQSCLKAWIPMLSKHVARSLFKVVVPPKPKLCLSAHKQKSSARLAAAQHETA